MNARAGSLRRQRGVAALELALITVAVFWLLPFVFWFGRLFYEYNVLLKAGHQAARYVAAVPALEIGSFSASMTAITTARQMVIDAGSGAGIDLSGVGFSVECAPTGCGMTGEAPATIRLRFTATAVDDLFFYFTVPLLGDPSFTFNIDITEPYGD